MSSINQESHSETIKSLAEKPSVVHLESLPTVSDLMSLALETKRRSIELGVSVYQATGESGEKIVGSTYNLGRESSIFEPEPPQKLRGKIKSGIFIHCHPIEDHERVDEGRSLHILPSGNTESMSGDFGASIWSRVIGGYLNVASEYGFTMCVGIKPISREDLITRAMREKLGSPDISKQTIWKVLSGEKSGTSFVGVESKQAINDKFSMNEDVIAFSHVEKDGVRYFLHVSWEALDKLVDDCGGIENIFFGDGLNLLLKKLEMDIPCKNNLGAVADIVHMHQHLPKSR